MSRRQPLAWFSLVLTTATLLGACAADTTDGGGGDGALGVAEQAAICLDCEPTDPPPPPPPPCGGRTIYSAPPTDPTWGYPQDASLIRYANRYSARTGYAAAFPNFNAAKYSGPMVFGTHLLPGATVAEWRDVPRATLGSPAIESIPDMMRAAHSYALQNGYPAALPTFEQGLSGGQVVYGISLLSSSAVEFRDVYACELSYPNLNDASQMFRVAHAYATGKGFAAAFPTFHSANYGSGTVYGLVLLRPGAADWRDVPYPDLYESCGYDAQVPCNASFDPGTWCDTGHWYDYNTGVCTDHAIPCSGLGEVCCDRTSCKIGLECANPNTTYSYCRIP